MIKDKFSTRFYLSFLKRSLSNKRKKQCIYIFLLSIFSAFAELFSVVAIFPIIGLLNGNISLDNNDFFIDLEFISRLLNIENKELLIIIIFSFLSIIASALRIFNFWYSGFISGRIGSDLGIKLYKKILKSNFNTFLKRNTSDFTTALTYNIQSVVSVTQGIMTGLNAITIISVLIISLLIYNFKVGILILLILSTIYIFIYRKTKRKFIKNSEIVYRARNSNLTSLKEGFSAIRNIIIDDASSIFIEKYTNSSSKEYSLIALNNTLSVAPKHILEASFLTLLAIMTLLSSIFFKSNSPINFFGLIAMGSIKLLPAIQQVFYSISQIKANQDSLLKISDLFDETATSQRVNQNLKTTHKFEKSLKFEGVSFSYYDDKNYVLKDINLEIKPGEFIGISGDTGSGKSTFIDLILGLIVPSKGNIILDGMKLKSNSKILHQWNKNVSHVPQSIFLCDSSVAENIAFGLKKSQIDFKKLKKVAEIAKVSNFINNLPRNYLTEVGEDGIYFSGGQKQRIAIARALYRDKDLIILDEATSALDASTEKEILDSLIKLKNKTIILISHNEKTLRYCSRILKVHNKCISEIH